MPQIRCRYIDCIFLESGFCAAELVKIDPDEGCMTYTRIEDMNLEETEDWEDEDLEDEDIEDLDEIWEDEEDEEEEGWIEDEIF